MNENDVFIVKLAALILLMMGCISLLAALQQYVFLGLVGSASMLTSAILFIMIKKGKKETSETKK